jgi:hypothetical protein
VFDMLLISSTNLFRWGHFAGPKYNVLPVTLVEIEPKVEITVGEILAYFLLGRLGPFPYFHELDISVSQLPEYQAKSIAGRLSQEAC